MHPDDLPLHVETAGPAPVPGRPTFVLLHGYTASGFSWRHWVPRLAELGPVVQIDLKGHGRAPKPDDGRYAPADQAELVLRLLEARDLDDIVLVGHSLGGGVALLVALGIVEGTSPSRLRGLVALASVAYEQRLPPFVRLAEWPRLSSLLLRAVGIRTVVAGALRAVVYDPAVVSTTMIDGYARPLRSPAALRALITAARQVVPPDLPALTRRYGKISVPTLLLWGRQDRVVPLAVGRRLCRELPDAQLHVLDRCGHLPQEERPSESFDVLVEFLRSTEGLPVRRSRPHRGRPHRSGGNG